MLDFITPEQYFILTIFFVVFAPAYAASQMASDDGKYFWGLLWIVISIIWARNLLNIIDNIEVLGKVVMP